MESNEKSDIIITRQINYIILEKLWLFVKGEEQEKIPPGTVGLLYDALGLTQNAYSKIRAGNTDRHYKLEKFADEKKKKEHLCLKDIEENGRNYGHLLIMGLPKEIMLGEEMIEINGITKEDWEAYLVYRYEPDRFEKDAKKKGITEDIYKKRTKVMRDMIKKLNIAFKELYINTESKKPIDIAYYFCKRGFAISDNINDREMKELQVVLKKIKPDKIKGCDSTLRKEVYDEIKKVYKLLDIMIQYENEFEMR